MNSPKPTREERREAARAQAERLRQQQAARERRSRNILLLVLAGILVVVAVLAVWIVSEANKPKPNLLDSFEGTAPTVTDDRGAFVVGASGLPGEPTEGAQELRVYLDFMCVHCANFEQVNGADLDELRTSGDLNVEYNIVAFMDYASPDQFSTRAANAATTIAEEAPEAFVPFVEGIFALNPSSIGGLSDEQIAEVAATAGVPQDVIDTFADGIYNDWIAVVADQAKQDEVTGTPTVFHNGERMPEDVNYFGDGVLSAWLVEQSGGVPE